MYNFFVLKIWSFTTDVAAPKAWAIAKILIFFFGVRYIANRLIRQVLKSVAARGAEEDAVAGAGRIRTLGGLIRSIVFYVLIFIAGVMTLRVFDIDPAPVLTTAGVLGLAVGFGAQKLVRDIISGFFVVLEDHYHVGERVTIGAITGEVVDLGMRVTKLRDDTGKLVIIANGDINQVINHSRGPIQAVIEINIAPDSDLEKVRAVLDDAGQRIESEVEGVITPPKVDGVSAVDATKLTISVSGTVKPGRQAAVQSALRELILERFRAEGIKFAESS